MKQTQLLIGGGIFAAIIIVIIIVVILKNKEKYDTPLVPVTAPNVAAPGNYLIADSSGNLSTTTSGVFDSVAVNAVTSNSVTTNAIQAQNLQLANHIDYPTSLLPYTVRYIIQEYKGPVFDANNNTFSADKWTLKTSGGAVVGVRNGKWWITQYPDWANFTDVVVEFIPIPLNSYYSSYQTHNAIASDTKLDNGWGTPPVNNNYNSLQVYPDNSSTSPTIIKVAPSSF